VTIGAVVEQVDGVLGRAHALFADPPSSGGSAASGAGSRLGAAGQVVRSNERLVLSHLSGEFATGYRTFAGNAGPALDGLAGVDERLGGQLRSAADSDRGGRAASGAVINGALADSTVLAPFTTTPTGERALIVALRRRVAHQQQVVSAYRLRDARMAAVLRSMAYATRSAGGASGGSALGGGGFGGSAARGLGSAWAPSMSAASPPISPARQVRRVAAFGPDDGRAAAVPAGPGGTAVRAALGKRGVPYVWGAKGPNNFDCSGLTQWAWRQAGVQLGPDTYTQIRQGVPVSAGEVRAGDLIFPTSSFDGRGPGHVQLAISATEVVHAPQTGDVVRVAPMPSGFVARRPVPLP
jgi:cell wall-associated NlpC family hydrolase